TIWIQPPWVGHIFTSFIPSIPFSQIQELPKQVYYLFETENIAGKLVFYQMEGNATFVRDTGELASDVPTETMFELFDPPKNFSTANFTYTWDLGNGEVIQGTEPVVRYHYSESGNYTLRLKVGVNLTKYSPGITGLYSTDVQVLGLYTELSSSVCVCVCSPPMWVCWRFLQNCVPDTMGGCTLTMLYENTLRLNHTFTSVGVHCLDISVRNDVSKLETSFSLNVKRNSEPHTHTHTHTHMKFEAELSSKTSKLYN
uniref:PKD domain-containing protein n=1 Tax=Echeneis naucrates TaxID=173247 RepID=A0A665WQB4_ECHNA